MTDISARVKALRASASNRQTHMGNMSAADSYVEQNIKAIWDALELLAGKVSEDKPKGVRQVI